MSNDLKYDLLTQIVARYGTNPRKEAIKEIATELQLSVAMVKRDVYKKKVSPCTPEEKERLSKYAKFFKVTVDVLKKETTAVCTTPASK